MNQLMNYIRSGQINEVKSLLMVNRELVNQKDDRGFTPLIMSTYTGNLELTKLLIELGADVDLAGAAGNTALMGVAFKGSLEMTNLLLTSGADIDQKNDQGETALIYAVKFNQPEIAKLLVDEGADVTIKDVNGLDAFHDARNSGNTQMVLALEGES